MTTEAMLKKARAIMVDLSDGDLNDKERALAQQEFDNLVAYVTASSLHSIYMEGSQRAINAVLFP